MPTAQETASGLRINPEAARILLGDRQMLSLDGDQCHKLLEEVTQISSDGLPEPSASYAELQETIRVCLATLDPRLAQVVEGRSGMGSGASQTLEEMGKVLGVTRERVRQIEKKAIGKLQHSSRARTLAPFLGEVPLPTPPSEEHDASGSRRGRLGYGAKGRACRRSDAGP